MRKVQTYPQGSHGTPSKSCDSWYEEVSDSVAHQNLEHLSPLKWIPEYAAVVDDMKRHVEDLRLRERALAEMKMHEKALRDARKRYGRVDKDGSITVADKSKEMDGIKQLVQVLMVAMGALSVPDDLVHGSGQDDKQDDRADDRR